LSNLLVEGILNVKIISDLLQIHFEQIPLQETFFTPVWLLSPHAHEHWFLMGSAEWKTSICRSIQKTRCSD